MEVMSVDEDDVIIEADDDVTDDVAADGSPKNRHKIHIHGPDHPRGERTKKFFSELRSLSLSRRRFEAEAQVKALRTGVFSWNHNHSSSSEQVLERLHAPCGDTCDSQVRYLISEQLLGKLWYNQCRLLRPIHVGS